MIYENNFCGAYVIWITYSDDQGKDERHHWKRYSGDDGTDSAYKNVWPLSNVEMEYFQKWHRWDIFILQKNSKELCHLTLPLALRRRVQENETVVLNLI